mgnify:CR=1 FL=1
MKMTEEQIKIAFNAVLGIDPRAADIQVIQRFGNDIDTLVDMLWDHWMGEPKTPTRAAGKREVTRVLKEEIK